jgi:hypothetical protein
MRLCRQQYKGRAVKTRESAKWYAEIKEHVGRRRRMPGFTDKGATAELGRQVERLVASAPSSSLRRQDFLHGSTVCRRDSLARLPRGESSYVAGVFSRDTRVSGRLITVCALRTQVERRRESATEAAIA